MASIPVSFSISGPGHADRIRAQLPTVPEQAQVNVIAGSTTGAVTVTATAGGFSQTFSLTVIPQGPTITGSSFYNGADFQQGSISPCSIATIMAAGIAPSIQGAVAYDGIGGLPYNLAGDAVTFGGAQAPIYNVANMNGQQQLTFQVPCSVTPGSAAGDGQCRRRQRNGQRTGSAGQPGLFTTQLSSTTLRFRCWSGRTVRSSARPTRRRRGETLIAYVTGLGPTSPAVATNSLPVPGSNATVQGTVIVGRQRQRRANLISASLTPDIVGVYEVAFQVPIEHSERIRMPVSPSASCRRDQAPYTTARLGYFPVQ